MQNVDPEYSNLPGMPAGTLQNLGEPSADKTSRVNDSRSSNQHALLRLVQEQHAQHERRIERVLRQHQVRIESALRRGGLNVGAESSRQSALTPAQLNAVPSERFSGDRGSEFFMTPPQPPGARSTTQAAPNRESTSSARAKSQTAAAWDEPARTQQTIQFQEVDSDNLVREIPPKSRRTEAISGMDDLGGDRGSAKSSSNGKGDVKDSVGTVSHRLSDAMKAVASGGLFNKHSTFRVSAAEDLDDEEDAPPARRCAIRCKNCLASVQKSAQKITKKNWFDYVIGFFIVINAGTIGAQTDHDLRHLNEDTPLHFRYIDLTFTLLFTLELVLRIVAEQTLFFSCVNKNLSWNVLDSFIVFSALLEEAFTLFMKQGQLPAMQAMRLLRILRLVRVVRIIRVMRFFRDLRMMVYGIMSSLKSLVWCLMLLFLIMYMMAVCVMQIMAGELAESNQDGGKIDEDLLMQYFGSLVLCLYTLHISIFGGVDWNDVAEPLGTVSWGLVILFMMYISFSILCVLNVVTGVFVENANKITMQDEDHMIMEELSARKIWFEEVKQLFLHADADGSGEVEWPEFVQVCSDMRVQAFFRKIGIMVEASGTYGLFQLLDFDGDGKVDVDEFVLGIQQLHGHARSLDIVKLQYMNKALTKKVDDLTQTCKSNMAEQRALLGIPAPDCDEGREGQNLRRAGRTEMVCDAPLWHNGQQPNLTSGFSGLSAFDEVVEEM